jgi:hypothetical protein
MIQLDRDKLVIADGKGGECDADTTCIRKRLNAAFEQCDIQKSWLAESLTEILEERIRSGHQRGELLAMPEIERLVSDVLCGSGLADVAEIFRNMPSSFREREEDFREPAASSSAVRLIEVPTRYIKSEEWLPDVPDESRILLERRLVRLMPASDLLPMATIECRPARLHDYNTPPDASGTLEEHLGALCRLTVPLLAAMKARIVREWPEARRPDAHIRFAGMPAFLQLSAHGSGSRRILNNLRRQATGIIREQINAGADFPVSISYN